MIRVLALALCALAAGTAAAQLPSIRDLVGNPSASLAAPEGRGDERTRVAGVREALAVGTEKAVRELGRRDGYYRNEAVKILLPPKIRRVGEVARVAGFQREVDELVVRMNRAAETAAPLAARHFGDAIRAMTLEDVHGIIAGGDTAATEFFERRTRDRIYAAFRPAVAKSIGEAGATRAYTDLMGHYEALPFVRKPSLDLEHYVTDKALDGLFHRVSLEEKRIRRDPAARTSELLRTVFGG